jgi:hypothetical protein
MLITYITISQGGLGLMITHTHTIPGFFVTYHAQGHHNLWNLPLHLHEL